MPSLKDDAVGICLKSLHYQELLENNAPVDFLEGHIENYCEGGFHLKTLADLKNKYPISLHGVGLSLGSSSSPLMEDILIRKRIIDTISPVFFSEHAAWTRHKNAHLNDLLPLPLTHKIAKNLADNISKTQDIFKRTLLIENLTSYITFPEDVLTEAEFMNEVCSLSGCHLLLDVNNIVIQEHNLGRNAEDFLKTIKPAYVKQYHLAGGERLQDTDFICDTHGTDIPDSVFAFYKKALQIIGLRPTLYERDNNIPPLQDMLEQVIKIRAIQKQSVEAYV